MNRRAKCGERAGGGGHGMPRARRRKRPRRCHARRWAWGPNSQFQPKTLVCVGVWSRLQKPVAGAASGLLATSACSPHELPPPCAPPPAAVDAAAARRQTHSFPAPQHPATRLAMDADQPGGGTELAEVLALLLGRAVSACLALHDQQLDGAAPPLRVWVELEGAPDELRVKGASGGAGGLARASGGAQVDAAPERTPPPPSRSLRQWRAPAGRRGRRGGALPRAGARAAAPWGGGRGSGGGGAHDRWARTRI